MEYKFSKTFEKAIQDFKKELETLLRIAYLDGKQDGLNVLEESLREKTADEV